MIVHYTTLYYFHLHLSKVGHKKIFSKICPFNIDWWQQGISQTTSTATGENGPNQDLDNGSYKKEIREVGLELVNKLSLAAGVTAKDKRMRDKGQNEAEAIGKARKRGNYYKYLFIFKQNFLSEIFNPITKLGLEKQPIYLLLPLNFFSYNFLIYIF